MAVHLVALLVCVVGAVLYLVAKRPDVRELARLAFACGLLVVLLRMASDLVIR